jgi:hypothetical protein
VYEKIINDMDILSHYYLIDASDHTLLHSKVDPKYLKQVFSISQTEFNV